MRTAARPRPFGREVHAVHLVGAGGTGMAPLALYLRQSGMAVSGEDDAFAPPVRALLEEGGVTVTEAGDLPDACDLLVHSSAIGGDHPACRWCAGARCSRN